ncbi:hypothetical protein K474DRAFT_1656418 [Panus rudis PR-1116 ss-1]|nr:hypothetical protein K474DRAFT_1656418 [Panus rudis PR-1116 ss-1]
MENDTGGPSEGSRTHKGHGRDGIRGPEVGKRPPSRTQAQLQPTAEAAAISPPSSASSVTAPSNPGHGPPPSSGLPPSLHLLQLRPGPSKFAHVGYPRPMASINSLPTELIVHIFALGVQDEADPDSVPPGSPKFEVLVSHVCRYWREVALTASNLWTTIHFRTVPHMHRAEEYLSRSGRMLIDVVVDTTSETEHKPGFTLFRNEFRQVFSIVTPHIVRWRSLSLKVRDLQCKAAAREVLSSCGSAPELQRLELWHIENWGNAEHLFDAIGPPPVVVFDESLPSLRSVSLIGVNLPWRYSSFLRNLISIQLALHSNDVRIPYPDWYRMLSESPGLRSLSLHYSGPKNGEWPEDRVRLEELREVSLTDMDSPEYVQKLFSRLYMPNVSTLKLEAPGQDYSPLLHYFADAPQEYVPHSPDDDDSSSMEVRRGPVFPQLESLTVVILESDKDGWRAFLRSSSTLRQVDFDFSEMSDGLFDVLFEVAGQSGSSSSADTDMGSGVPSNGYAPAPSVLLPSLRSVRFAGLTSHQVRAYITFRRSHRCQIQKWHLEERIRDAKMIKWMKETSMMEVILPESAKFLDLSEVVEWDGDEEKERIIWFKGEDVEDDDDLVEGDDEFVEEEDV